ncbi:MAG TPA: CoA-transferase [Syntrophorhabdales bacterium]|nr:CoA-transferase [Syntrophorhabdales bacterium]
MTWYPDIREKLMSPAEAVQRFIKNGSQIALGGFTVNRNPMAIAYEIIRQEIKDLHVVCHSQGQSFDVLVGAGCVKRVELAYGAMGRFAPTCIRFRKAVERADIEVEDYSNNQMSLRFLAGSLSIPFIPSRSGFETDLLRKEGFSKETRSEKKVARKKIVEMADPFDDNRGKVVLLPALNPDVAIVHAQYVGEDGTVRIKGLTFADVEQAKAADAVIVTCEEIVPKSFIRLDPDQNSLPPFLIDAIVRVPYGAHPTACRLFYDYDAKHLNMYRHMARDDAGFKRYLDEWVLTPRDHEQYLDKIGASGLMTIRANPVIGYTPGLDRR